MQAVTFQSISTNLKLSFECFKGKIISTDPVFRIA